MIYDLQRSISKLIPNDLYYFLVKNRKISRNSLNHNFGKSIIVSEYWDFLIENEFIFEVNSNTSRLFPEMNLEYQSPSIINTISITWTNLTIGYLDFITKKINQLGVKQMIFFINNEFSFSEIELIMNNLNRTKIRSIQIIFSDVIYLKNWFQILNKKPIITMIKIFNISSDINRIAILSKIKTTPIKFIEQDLISFERAPDKKLSFNINITLFCESLIYNNFFNQSVYINGKGLISNSFNNLNYYGFLTELKRIVKSRLYMRLWFVNKDRIKICRDCERRYMCIDSGIPEKLNLNLWKMNLECNYNPYIAKWKHEVGYIKVQETIEQGVVGEAFINRPYEAK